LDVQEPPVVFAWTHVPPEHTSPRLQSPFDWQAVTTQQPLEHCPEVQSEVFWQVLWLAAHIGPASVGGATQAPFRHSSPLAH
jgi:hypothetical protein